MIDYQAHNCETKDVDFVNYDVICGYGAIWRELGADVCYQGEPTPSPDRY